MSRPYVKVGQQNAPVPARRSAGLNTAVIVGPSPAGEVDTAVIIDSGNPKKGNTTFGPGPLRTRITRFFEGGGGKCISVRAAAAAIGAVGAVVPDAANTGTQDMTVAATSVGVGVHDHYHFRVEILSDADANGNSKFRVSRDGGRTWGKTYTMSGAGTATHADAESGVTLSFPKDATKPNSYKTGDGFEMETTPPVTDWAGIDAALTAAAESGEPFKWIIVAGAMTDGPFATTEDTAVNDDTFNTVATGIETLLTGDMRDVYKEFARCSLEADMLPLRADATARANWYRGLTGDSDFNDWSGETVQVVAAWRVWNNPYSGDQLPVNDAALLCGWRLSHAVHVSVAAPVEGPLPVGDELYPAGAFALSEDAGELDALHDLGYETTRNHRGLDGVFPAHDRMKADDDSDFVIAPRCRIADKASTLLYQQSLKMQHTVRSIAAGIPKAVAAAEAQLTAALDPMAAAEEISGPAKVTIDASAENLAAKKLTYSWLVTDGLRFENIEGEGGFDNPFA